MQSRLIINGKEVDSPIVQRLILPLILAFLALLFIAVAVFFVSVVGIALAVGAGLAGLGLGGAALHRLVNGRTGASRSLSAPADRSLPESRETGDGDRRS